MRAQASTPQACADCRVPFAGMFVGTVHGCTSCGARVCVDCRDARGFCGGCFLLSLGPEARRVLDTFRNKYADAAAYFRSMADRCEAKGQARKNGYSVKDMRDAAARQAAFAALPWPRLQAHIVAVIDRAADRAQAARA